MIGIFDSGSGGLTVLAELRRAIPSADVVYFGDIKNAPYGSRAQEELSTLTLDALTFLQNHGATKIISACNSVSASLVLSVFDAFDIQPGQIIEMVGPTVAHFKGSTQSILVLATPATIRSGIYQNAFRMTGKEIDTLALPDLVEAIETGASDDELRLTLQPLQTINKKYNVVILACTHYPLVQKLFKEFFPSDTTIFDPAVVVAQRAKKLFLLEGEGKRVTKFFISKESQPFRNLAMSMFPEAVVEVVQYSA